MAIQRTIIGDRFRHLRTNLEKKTLEAFAEKLDCDKATLSRIESGITKNPRFKILMRAEKIAREHGYSLFGPLDPSPIGFQVPT